MPIERYKPKKPQLYSYQYKKIRKRLLRENPFCQICLIKGKEIPNWATQIHHIDHNAENNSLSNLCPICKECHEKEHS